MSGHQVIVRIQWKDKVKVARTCSGKQTELSDWLPFYLILLIYFLCIQRKSPLCMLSEQAASLIKSVNGPTVFSITSECHSQTHWALRALALILPAVVLSTSYFSQIKVLIPEQSMLHFASKP